MSSEGGEIVLTIDLRRLLALSVIFILTVVTAGSYLIALFAFIAPSEEIPLQVTSVATYDTSDVSETFFARGSTVRIKATVEKATGYYYNTYSYYYPYYNTYTYYYPYTYYDYTYYYYYDHVDTTYRIIIAVMDSNNRPVFFESTTKTIWPGQSLVTSYDYAISSGASTGTYTIRVMTWSDWLPHGVTMMETVGEGSFEVTS